MTSRAVAKMDALRDELADICATEHRVCVVCGVDKPLAAFYARLPKTGLGSHRTTCQSCRDAAKASAVDRRKARDAYEASIEADRVLQAERLANIAARIAAGEHPLVANGWMLTAREVTR